MRTMAGVALIVATLLTAGIGPSDAREPRTGLVVVSLDPAAADAAAGLRRQIRRSVADFGGRIVIRNEQPQALVGDAPGRLTVIRFRSYARARQWADTPNAHEIGDALKKAGHVSVLLMRGDMRDRD